MGFHIVYKGGVKIAKTKENTVVYSNGLSDFLAYLRTCEQQYKIADSEEKTCDDITQDILHCLELESHDRTGYAKLGRKQKEVRERRRKAKNIKAQLHPITTWINNNQPQIKEMERVLGEMRKAEKSNNGYKVYVPRTKEILEIQLHKQEKHSNTYGLKAN